MDVCGLFPLIVQVCVVLLAGLWYLISELFTKRWRRAAVILSAMVLTIIASPKLYDLYQIRNIFGTWVFLPDPTVVYESERTFHGDGYTIVVYELPKSLQRRFELADASSLREFPSRPWFRSEWETRPWTQGPAGADLEPFIDFAVPRYQDGPAYLPRIFEKIRVALTKPTTFYSFHYKAHEKDYPSNIDFFVIDLEKRQMYIINHNT